MSREKAGRLLLKNLDGGRATAPRSLERNPHHFSAEVAMWLLILLLFCFPLSGTEVSGHLTEDTTWTLEQSPYLVVGDVTVNSGVTLTIEPGVTVLIHSVLATDFNGYDLTQVGGEAEAKMIRVNGRIVAVGTAEQPIVFDKAEADSTYRWGTIYCPENAPESVFEHCVFSHSAWIALQTPLGLHWAEGALCLENGKGRVRNCAFYENWGGIWVENATEQVLIYRDSFVFKHPFEGIGCMSFGIMAHAPYNVKERGSRGFIDYDFIIANCLFDGEIDMYDYYNAKSLFLNNTVKNRFYYGRPEADRDRNPASESFYGNRFFRSDMEVVCYTATASDTVFCRRNFSNHINNNVAAAAGYGTGMAVVSDNISLDGGILGCSPFPGGRARVYNNFVVGMIGNYGYYLEGFNQSETDTIDVECYNNVLINPGVENAIYTTCNIGSFHNNIVIGGEKLFGWDVHGGLYENNIILCDPQWIGPIYDVIARPLFRNNLVSVPIDTTYVIDGGGNFMADPLFADSTNYDFHLLPGSPCIDTGAMNDSLPTFDADYFHRIVDGNNDGAATIDIGPYEFGSLRRGEIQGFVYDAETGEPVECAMLEIHDYLPEFSDSVGCFPFPTGPGTFTVRASRWDYDNAVIEGVVVEPGQTLALNIPLNPASATDPGSGVVPRPVLELGNFPNPFNPKTKIWYNLPKPGPATVAIYNLRGQVVRTLVDERQEAGQHQVLWNGTDDNGRTVSSGVYLYRLDAGGKHKTEKFLLLK
jgi:hypothetical protein